MEERAGDAEEGGKGEAAAMDDIVVVEEPQSEKALEEPKGMGMGKRNDKEERESLIEEPVQNKRKRKKRNAKEEMERSKGKTVQKKGKTSDEKKYKGVNKTREGRFQTNITHRGETEYLGTYSTAEDAAKAYDKRARELGKSADEY